MGWIVDGFLRLQFDEFMSLPVAGFSRVHKPTSWFALHFIYERGVYLVLVTQRQQASTICLLPWGWPSSVTPFFYIKPQRGDKTTIQPKVVLYRFSTSNHNTPTLTQVSNYVVLYRFSTSNHNNLRSSSSNLWLYYIVSLHQTTTEREFETIMLSLYYIVSLHQTTTPSTIRLNTTLLYYIVSLHQTTTWSCLMRLIMTQSY